MLFYFTLSFTTIYSHALKKIIRFSILALCVVDIIPQLTGRPFCYCNGNLLSYMFGTRPLGYVVDFHYPSNFGTQSAH